MADEQAILIEYLRHAYHAVDGLWFMMVEQTSGFDQALELDRRVWDVLAKIEARKARSLTGCGGNTPAELIRCFGLKLEADGQQFESHESEGDVRFVLRRCAWADLLRRSNRDHLAARIGEVICKTEGRAWCAEFGGEYEFHIPVMGCAGGDRCEMCFARRQQP